MKKVLVVDDEEAVRSVICALLKADDREFIEAVNGEEAQKFLDASCFDLVISDVIMPDCDGIELVMAIRRKQPDVPVIIISGGGRVNAGQYLSMAEKLGAASVFEKPFDTSAFRSTAARLLGEAEDGAAAGQETP